MYSWAYIDNRKEEKTIPKKIKNMLREGLPSKIYWYAFAEPTSGYEIAKKIYKPKGRPDVSKVYTYTKPMIKKEILRRISEKKIQSNPEPLVNEIETILKTKKVHLTEIEKKRVLRILQNKFFQETVLATIRRENPFRARAEIDAASELSQILGICSVIQYPIIRSVETEVKNIAEELNAEVANFEKENFKEYNSNNPIENFLNYLSIDLPKKLIKLLPVDVEETWNVIEETQKIMQDRLKA